MSASIRTPDFLLNHTGKTPYLPSDPWVIECLAALEAEAGVPVLTKLALASSIRRATVYAALAAIKLDRAAQVAVAELSPAELIDWLLTAEPRHIVEVTLGDAEGLPGVIAKVFEPLRDPATYLWIAAAMRATTERTRKQAICLRHVTRHVNSDLCEVLSILRTRLLRPGIVSGIGSPERARHVEALVAHVSKVAPSIPPDVIAQSLEAGLGDLFRWASRMILRHGVGLDGSLCDCEDFTILRTGEDYKRAADRYRNCLADETQGRALAASFGVSAVAEWRHGKVLTVLSMMSDGGDQPVWVCDRLWGPVNSAVSEDDALTVTKALRRRGILTLSTTAPAAVAPELLAAYVDREDYLTLPFRQLGA